MGREIERKFLIVSEAWRRDADAGVELIQGYADTGVSGITLRFRLAGEQAFLTVKGPASGIVRSEFEYPIPVSDCRQMLSEFCGDRIVEKIRYHVSYGGFLWEIDEYKHENAGLFTAEIELPEPYTVFSHPVWLGEEVTGDHRYSNGALSRLPWRRWPERQKKQ